ncbi:hypothetical protein FG183_15025 [Serratia marcescens subsp. marcescens ATCC 13880]|nr:hypothetical protein FG183_15025 [Serratia marcescens subsp. marcescens ATCC 13880]
MLKIRTASGGGLKSNPIANNLIVYIGYFSAWIFLVTQMVIYTEFVAYMQIFVLLFWFGDAFVRIDLKKIIFWRINIVFKTFFYLWLFCEQIGGQ